MPREEARRPGGDAPTLRTRRGERSRPAAPTQAALLGDEQSLLAGAVRRLRDGTRADLVAAWALRPESGAPYVAAAAFAGPPPVTPDAAAFAAAAALPRTTALGRGELPPALAPLLARHRAAAVAPVCRREGDEPLAILILSSQEPDALRPRALAALATSAQRLTVPLATARAARRLARVDAAVQRLDRLAALGTLAAEIAHEVRNPLVSVKTFLQLLPERRHDPEFGTRFLAVAQQELARVERLLDVLIAYPRAPEQAESASLETALAAVVELLHHPAAARGVRIETAIDAPLAPLATSPDALQQILLNVVLNALEASPAGTAVRISVRTLDDGAEIAVADQGPGLPAEGRERLFEPFASERGASHGGLGLPITRRLAQEAGGRVGVEDSPEGGAIFRIWLPAHSS
jgi:signal transduction histidine kinase